jgi:hypothetical protein
MKNTFKVFGIIALLMVIIVFSMTASTCFGGGSRAGSADGGEAEAAPAASRSSDDGAASSVNKLTITGLDRFNGKYVLAVGSYGNANGGVAVGAVDGQNVMLGQISNGSVSLQFYDGEYSGLYAGSDTVDFYITILSKQSFTRAELNNPMAMVGVMGGMAEATVIFNRGTGSGKANVLLEM